MSQQQKPSTQSTTTQQKQPFNKNKPTTSNTNTKPTTGAPSTRGGARGGARAGGVQKPRTTTTTGAPKQSSRTVFVGRIFFDDLLASNISGLAEKLKDQRVRMLRDLFTSLGEVEAIETHVEDEVGHMLITYVNREAAKNVMLYLRNKERLSEEMDKIKAKLSQQKQFPPNVCPELFKYRYDWSDKPAKSITSGNKKNAGPKNVVAGQSAESSSQADSAEAKKSKKATKKAKQTTASAIAAAVSGEEPTTTVSGNKQAGKSTATNNKSKQQATSSQTVAPPKQQVARDLQRQAEMAKLTEELNYLQNQQSHVANEVDAERKRAKERDNRIVRLSAELSRVREEEQALTTKLNAEQTYKADGDSRIQKLNQELSHMKAEEQVVLQKIQSINNPYTQQQNGVC